MNGEVGNGDGDASLVRRLRAAEASLDERPSPRVRQAVMRAAAGRSAARPPSAVGRMLAAARRLPPAWRWSAPVAASVLVGAIAVELVAEVHRATEPVPAASERAPAASTGAAGAARQLHEPQEPKPATPAAVAPAAVAPPAAPAQNAAQAAPAPRPRKSEPEAASAAPQGAADAARMEMKPPAAQEAAPVRSTAVIAASVPPPAPGAPEAPAASQADAAARARAAVPMAKQSATPPASEPQSAQQWIERIIALRRAGRDQEADRELEQLRQRYPGLTVPPAALR